METVPPPLDDVLRWQPPPTRPKTAMSEDREENDRVVAAGSGGAEVKATVATPPRGTKDGTPG